MRNPRLQALEQPFQNLFGVTDKAHVGQVEDGSVGIVVNSHDSIARTHPNLVLESSGDSAGYVKFGGNGDSGLSDLVAVWDQP